MSRSQKDYLKLLQQLLPLGIFWTGWKETSGKGYQLLKALANAPARLDKRGDDLLREVVPLTTSEMLSAREIEAGLPDSCTAKNETFFVRRERLIQKWRSRGGLTPAYLVDVGKSAGFDITVQEPRPFRAGQSMAGHSLTNDPWRHWFRVSARENTVKDTFRAGLGRAGEPLRVWGNETLECLITKAKPAQSAVQFSYDTGGQHTIAGAVITPADQSPRQNE